MASRRSRANKKCHECDILAETVEDTCGVVMVTAFTGLGVPYWDSYVRGIITGLTRGVTKAHLCRATLESIALQVKDALDCITTDAWAAVAVSGGVPSAVPTMRGALKAYGGACVSDMLLQFQSDILNMEVVRPKNTETTVLGAALLAGEAVGFWTEERAPLAIDKIFTPSMTQGEREMTAQAWQKAVRQARTT